MSILLEIIENLNFGRNFPEIAILSIFLKITNLVDIFEKFQFQSKFSKHVHFGRHLRKIAIVKFCGNLEFGRNVRKSRFWSKFSKNLDFIRNLPKISIFGKICQNLDFGQILRKSHLRSKSAKISILMEKFQKSRFWWSKFLKTAILVEIFKKSWFWSIF